MLDGFPPPMRALLGRHEGNVREIRSSTRSVVIPCSYQWRSDLGKATSSRFEVVAVKKQELSYSRNVIAVAGVYTRFRSARILNRDFVARRHR